MKDFSQSLVAVSVFMSNILFWREAGYFGAETELKPLLHTWSLALEEQYYVLFPLFLMLFWRLGKRWILFTLMLLFVVSLALAQWLHYTKPDAAFYLLPTRIWELLIGAFAAFYSSKQAVNIFDRVVSEVAGWSGVALILYAVFAYSKATPFLNLYFTFVTTLGAVLIILFATQKTTAGKFLGNKAFVSVGLISYSLYLWHQPIFAFVRHKKKWDAGGLTEDGHGLFILLFLLTFVLAYLSWKYVEAPFRKREIVSTRLIFSLGFFFTSLFITIGYIGHVKNGFESRIERVLSGDVGNVDFHKYIDENYYDCEPKIIAENALNFKGILRCKQSKQGTPEIILLGDSHAEHLFIGLAEYVPSKNIAYYMRGAKPYVEVNDFKHIFNELLNNRAPQHIILTMNYVGKLDFLGTGLYEGFSNAIKTLLKEGKSVTLVGDVPKFNQDPEFCVYYSSAKLRSVCALSRDDIEEQSSSYEGILKRLAKEYGLTYLSFDDDFCADNFCSMAKGDEILYRDTNHLNIIGSKLVGKSLAERLYLK
jgi:hypothetical protein